MKLPDWNAAEWVLVLTLSGLAFTLVALILGLERSGAKLP